VLCSVSVTSVVAFWVVGKRDRDVEGVSNQQNSNVGYLFYSVWEVGCG
jgi:hypothetical protein